MDKQRYLRELEELFVNNGEAVEDVEAAIRYAEYLIDKDVPVIFNREHFAALLGSSLTEINRMMSMLESSYYTERKIPKKSEGYRTLMVPAMKLKLIQQWILQHILYKIGVSPHAMGFCKNKSIVTNAKPHLGKDCVVNMDLKDFFPSVSQEQVFRIFYACGYTVDVSYMLSRLCTVDGKLPQGSPASPYLSNIVCISLDRRLAALADKYEATYTRYADDITFSGKYGVQNIIKVAKMIIESEGFYVNDRKTRVLFKYQRQEVTGINVSGDKLSIDKKYKKQFMQEIYYCKKYGPHNHLMHIHCDKRFYKEHMYGRAYFVNMVDRELGSKILNLLDEVDWDR